jgi:enoyl-CoA hydratase
VPLIDGGTVRLPRLIGESRAMDLILTGRPVDAAVELAEQLAKFPQTCMHNDRQSARKQHGLSKVDAIAQELAYGKQSLAADTPAGAGRHGEF